MAHWKFVETQNVHLVDLSYLLIGLYSDFEEKKYFMVALSFLAEFYMGIQLVFVLPVIMFIEESSFGRSRRVMVQIIFLFHGLLMWKSRGKN